jgi:hypothetical protein
MISMESHCYHGRYHKQWASALLLEVVPQKMSPTAIGFKSLLTIGSTVLNYWGLKRGQSHSTTKLFVHITFFKIDALLFKVHSITINTFMELWLKLLTSLKVWFTFPLLTAFYLLILYLSDGSADIVQFSSLTYILISRKTKLRN